MDNMEIKFIEKLLESQSRALVGRLCKQNEVLQSNSSININQKMVILKDLSKDLVYETFRDLLNNIKYYNLGLKYQKYKIYKPTK